jgi:hypothetical protein
MGFAVRHTGVSCVHQVADKPTPFKKSYEAKGGSHEKAIRAIHLLKSLKGPTGNADGTFLFFKGVISNGIAGFQTNC